MAKDRKESEKKRPTEDVGGDPSFVEGLRRRRKATERGDLENRNKAFREGMGKKQSGDGTGGAKEND